MGDSPSCHWVLGSLFYRNMEHVHHLRHSLAGRNLNTGTGAVSQVKCRDLFQFRKNVQLRVGELADPT